MELIADGLLIATAMTAGLYCLVLSRRLGRLSESGNGIGPQIDALDQALTETRAALTEAREGMSELRNSAKTTIAQLTRETERGDEMAHRIERGLGEAKATLQRLYEVNDRIEGHESGPAGAAPAGADNPGGDAGAWAGEDRPEIGAGPDADENPSVDLEDQGDPAAIVVVESGNRAGPKVVLPGGGIETSAAPPAAAGENPKEQAGSVLKAERVML
jgi:hypothetical protein